jgi:Domain of unknown function (DUF4440)
MIPRTGRSARIILAALMTLAAVRVGPAASAGDPAVRRELEANYATYVRAVKQKDKAPLKQYVEKYTVSGFRQKMPDGRTLDRDQVITMLTQGMGAARIVDEQLKIGKVSVKGSEAVVEYTERTTAVSPDPQGGSHRIVASSTSRDTWVRTPGGWKLRLSEILAAKTLMDGKPVP